MPEIYQRRLIPYTIGYHIVRERFTQIVLICNDKISHKKTSILSCKHNTYNVLHLYWLGWCLLHNLAAMSPTTHYRSQQQV